jgi:hypothetical protein
MLEITTEHEFNEWLDLHNRRTMSPRQLQTVLEHRHEVENVTSKYDYVDQQATVSVKFKNGGSAILRKNDLESFMGGQFRIAHLNAGTHDYDFSRRDNVFVQVELTFDGNLSIRILDDDATVAEEQIVMPDAQTIQFASRTMPIDMMTEAVEQVIRTTLENQVKQAQLALNVFNAKNLY